MVIGGIIKDYCLTFAHKPPEMAAYVLYALYDFTLLYIIIYYSFSEVRTMEESKAEVNKVVTEETKPEEKKPEEIKQEIKKPEETKPDNLTETVNKIKADYEAKLTKQYTELQSQIKERDTIISQLLTTEKKEAEQTDIVTAITNKINAGHTYRKW